MKIKRFVAADMRQAMRDVREDQGAESVILSTRRIAEGIEIIAAIDYDEALVREAARHGMPVDGSAPHGTVTLSQTAPAPVPAPAGPASPGPASQGPRSLARACAAAFGRQSTPTAVAFEQPAAASHSPPPSLPPAPPELLQAEEPERICSPALLAVADPAVAEHPLFRQAIQDTAHMRHELSSLREMLETQFSSLAWNDMERRDPLRSRVLRELTRIGIDADVAKMLVAELPEQINADQARYLPLGILSSNLAVSGRGASVVRGVTALVGPTGVGKTTTIAKLAARAVLRHGSEQVALISTDHYRIGASAQLEHYGRLLGVRVYPAYDAENLRKVLDMLRGRHTVLIDTAGVGCSDPRLTQQMEIFSQTGELHTCMVLAANAQSQSLEQSVRAYMPLKASACILTKLDEAPNLGGALSVLIRHRLPLDYTTDGQRVPEDIAAADARALVCRAAQSMKHHVPEESLMAERFGLAVASA